MNQVEKAYSYSPYELKMSLKKFLPFNRDVTLNIAYRIELFHCMIVPRFISLCNYYESLVT